MKKYNEIIRDLNSLVGTSFQYRDRDLSLEKWTYNDSSYQYSLFVKNHLTDKQETITKHADVIENWLLIIRKSQTRMPPANKANSIPLFVNNNRGVFSSITEKLLIDMDKIEKDPEYVHQAAQRSRSAQVIVNIAKLELDAHKNL